MWLTGFIHIEVGRTPPPGLALPQLSTYAGTAQAVRRTVEPFMHPAAFEHEGVDFTVPWPQTTEAGALCVYLMGHGWLGSTGFETTIRRGERDELVSGPQLLEILRHSAAGRPLLLFFDTCHAGLLEVAARRQADAGVTTFLACGPDEETEEYAPDDRTRFSLRLEAAIQQFLNRSKVSTAELVRTLVAQHDRAGIEYVATITAVQTLPPLELSIKAGSAETSKRTNRAVRRLRRRLVAVGAVVVAIVAGLGWYFREHQYVDVDLGDWASSGGGRAVSIFFDDPEVNEHRLYRELSVVANQRFARLQMPVGDAIVVLSARYADRQERRIRFHVVTTAGWQLDRKLIHLVAPSNQEIEHHPGMAWVPATSWWQGPEHSVSAQSSPFWIDIYPTTAAEYRTALSKMPRSPETSELEVVDERARALETVDNGGTIKTLVGNMRDILAPFDAEGRPLQKQAPDEYKPVGIVPSDAPCDSCPAPMRTEDAQEYCAWRKMTLPTETQWELAARGADGRKYPWGNRFDAARANVVGLPRKGERTTLKPVSEFPTGASPFGVEDLSGNAGDWVDSEGGYAATYMGGGYWVLPEDATTYSVSPWTDSFPYEVAARCVSP